MQGEFETMNNEDTAQRSGDQGRRRHATRVWHSSDGELTCVRLYLLYENPEGPESLSRDA